MSEMKRRKSSEQGNPEASSDSLLKTSKKGDIELTEKELGMVTGGTDKTPLTETISLSFAKVNVEYKP
jgi:hypothetical protein